MTAVESRPLVGAGVDRVDGPRKVRGAAPYPSDVNLPRQAYAAIVQSTVAAGRIVRIDSRSAERAPGVLTVVTHENAPVLGDGPMTALGASPPAPLRDARILHHGQHIAFVVAETAEQAVAAARVVHVEYDRAEALLDIADPPAERVDNPWGLDSERGDSAAGLDCAHVTIAATYTTPDHTNNPLGLFSTVAAWDGDRLTVHDSTQWPSQARTTLSVVFGIPEDHVRVLAPFVGGGFGAGLRVWPHVLLTVMASRMLGRPVKLVLPRS